MATETIILETLNEMILQEEVQYYIDMKEFFDMIEKENS